MKVILGPLPCATCHAPVTIVRRDVEFQCPDGNQSGCGKDDCRCGDCMRHGFPYKDSFPCVCHTHTLPDVGPFTPVDEDGARHECSNG